MEMFAGKSSLHYAEVQLRGHPLQVQWTQRAARQLSREQAPIPVTMLLYFSCLVKKKVSFDEELFKGEQAKVAGGKLLICFRMVKPAACSPEEFAEKLPIGFEFDSEAASRMHPKSLSLDYDKGQWLGEFSLSR